jgi:hypothetical protein
MDQGQLHLIEIVLSLAGALILLLLGVIGFWIQKWIRSTDALTEAITNLKILFATTQVNVDDLKRFCDKRCELEDFRINAHADSIHQHTVDLELLKLKHCKYEK